MYNVFLLVLPFIVLCVCVYLTIIDYKIGIVPNRYIEYSPEIAPVLYG